MNPTAEQLLIGKRLRDLSASWIHMIRQSLQLFSMVPGNHRNFPLPLDFPFLNTPIQERIHWYEEGSATAFRYKFKVYFEYRRDRSYNRFPAIWIIRSSEISILGRVEVDYRILHDAESPSVLTADLVLEMMELSLLYEQPLRLSSRIISNGGDHEGTLDYIEVFDLRTFSDVWIREVRQRTLKARNCTTCGELVQPTGSHICLASLPETTSSTT